MDQLPDRSRVWVFVADQPVRDATPLLNAVDAHLADWKAHGMPLLCARAWQDDRVLVVAVDEAATGASGCSIDGLFRAIGRVQGQVGADLLASGRVVWRGADSALNVAMRAEFERRATAGEITAVTPVLDTLAETLGAWRQTGEAPAGDSWVRTLLPA
jgi:hypothetical protein